MSMYLVSVGIEGIEIERRFLINDLSEIPLPEKGTDIVQVYPSKEEWVKFWPLPIEEEIQELLDSPKSSVRIRSINGEFIATIKGESDGAERAEFEQTIKNHELTELIGSSNLPMIQKKRYIIPAADSLDWEIDIFEGDNAGLIIAEIELPTADHPLDLPDWLGEEVTGQDAAWSNHALALNPRPA